jgi:hypothetical protein
MVGTSEEIVEKRKLTSPALSSPALDEALQTNTQQALARLSAEALSALDEEGSRFIPHRYKNESGLVGAMREARSNGINVEAEMAHFSSTIAAHVREKIAEMGPAFLTLSMADLDRMAHAICKELRHDDDDDDDDYNIMTNLKRAQNNQPDDDNDSGILANFRRAAADAAEKAKQKQLADEIADNAVNPLHKATIRELLKDHHWRAAVKICFDIFLHPLLHLQNHMAGESVSLTASAPTSASRAASRPAPVRAPAPKGP